MGSFRSYAEQAAHYFNRPHERPATAPIAGAASWTGREMAQRTDWRARLDPERVEELRHAILHARTQYEDHPEPERKRHLLRR